LKKKGIGVIYLQPFNIMPQVGDKKFKYDEEGMEAAEAEAAKTGQQVEEASPNDSFMEAVTAGIEQAENPPSEDEVPQEILDEMLAAGDQAVTEEAAEQGDAGDVAMRLFNQLFGEGFNPEDGMHQEQMDQIQGVLDENPGMLEKLSLPRDNPDRMTDSEFAMMFFRGLEPEEPNV
tara:strand:- start:282 stop:809 length:528 start_codon:yes stop_codon:yes gene_type:complete